MKFHNPIFFFFIEYNELSLCISTVIDFYNLPLIKELNSFHWKMNYEIDLLHEINRDVEPHNLKITYKIEVLESHRLFLATLKYSFKEFNVSTLETWFSQQIL